METALGLPVIQLDTQQRNVLFLLVFASSEEGTSVGAPQGPRYTRDGLRSLLLLMGCKPRYAHKIVAMVFQRVTAQLPELSRPARRRSTAQRWAVWPHDQGDVSVSLPRADFNSLLLSCLAEFKYKPEAEALKIACSLRERRRCMIVLLCGTSGSGKSTLASLLASRLGIVTVLSTDSVRHLLRSFYSKEEAPLLFASTYEAGELFESMSAASAAKTASSACSTPPVQIGAASQQTFGLASGAAAATHMAVLAASQALPAGLAQLGPRERCIKGYKAQCVAVMAHVQQIIAEHEARRESMIIEGVHLSISQVLRLMARHPSVVPFLLYIKSEAKHVERMAVRAKYMALDPHKNKYVAHMQGIRWIQDYLVKKAESKGVPRVENTNVDRSVGLIHMTLLGVLRRVARGESVLDVSNGTARVMLAEYALAVESLVNASKGIVDALQQQQALRNASSALLSGGGHHHRDDVDTPITAPTSGHTSTTRLDTLDQLPQLLPPPLLQWRQHVEERSDAESNPLDNESGTLDTHNTGQCESLEMAMRLGSTIPTFRQTCTRSDLQAASAWQPMHGMGGVGLTISTGTGDAHPSPGASSRGASQLSTPHHVVTPLADLLPPPLFAAMTCAHGPPSAPMSDSDAFRAVHTEMNVPEVRVGLVRTSAAPAPYRLAQEHGNTAGVRNTEAGGDADWLQAVSPSLGSGVCAPMSHGWSSEVLMNGDAFGTTMDMNADQPAVLLKRVGGEDAAGDVRPVIGGGGGEDTEGGGSSIENAAGSVVDGCQGSQWGTLHGVQALQAVLGPESGSSLGLDTQPPTTGQLPGSCNSAASSVLDMQTSNAWPAQQADPGLLAASSATQVYPRSRLSIRTGASTPYTDATAVVVVPPPAAPLDPMRTHGAGQELVSMHGPADAWPATYSPSCSQQPQHIPPPSSADAPQELPHALLVGRPSEHTPSSRQAHPGMPAYQPLQQPTPQQAPSLTLTPILVQPNHQSPNQDHAVQGVQGVYPVQGSPRQGVQGSSCHKPQAVSSPASYLHPMSPYTCLPSTTPVQTVHAAMATHSPPGSEPTQPDASRTITAAGSIIDHIYPITSTHPAVQLQGVTALSQEPQAAVTCIGMPSATSHNSGHMTLPVPGATLDPSKPLTSTPWTDPHKNITSTSNADPAPATRTSTATATALTTTTTHNNSIENACGLVLLQSIISPFASVSGVASGPSAAAQALSDIFGSSDEDLGDELSGTQRTSTNLLQRVSRRSGAAGNSGSHALRGGGGGPMGLSVALSGGAPGDSGTEEGEVGVLSPTQALLNGAGQAGQLRGELGHAGHSSAAESDLDYLTLLDYASVYESTAAYDDGEDMDDAHPNDHVGALSPVHSIDGSPSSPVRQREPYSPDGGRQGAMGGTGGSLPSTLSGAGSTGSNQGLSHPWLVPAISGSLGGLRLGPGAGRTNSTMLRHLASALAHSRQRDRVQGAMAPSRGEQDRGAGSRSVVKGESMYRRRADISPPPPPPPVSSASQAGWVEQVEGSVMHVEEGSVMHVEGSVVQGGAGDRTDSGEVHANGPVLQ